MAHTHSIRGDWGIYHDRSGLDVEKLAVVPAAVGHFGVAALVRIVIATTGTVEDALWPQDVLEPLAGGFLVGKHPYSVRCG